MTGTQISAGVLEAWQMQTDDDAPGLYLQCKNVAQRDAIIALLAAVSTPATTGECEVGRLRAMAEKLRTVHGILSDGPDDSDNAMAQGLIFEAIELAKGAALPPSSGHTKKTMTCPHCGDVTKEDQPLLARYTCGECDEPFSPPSDSSGWEAGAEAMRAQCVAMLERGSAELLRRAKEHPRGKTYYDLQTSALAIADAGRSAATLPLPPPPSREG